MGTIFICGNKQFAVRLLLIHQQKSKLPVVIKEELDFALKIAKLM